MTRKDGRALDEVRATTIDTDVLKFPEGSTIIRCGETHVLCTASIEDGVPEFLRGAGKGWVTAEYAMHPRSTPRREARDGRRSSGVPGRSQEIQRLIGRALRAVVRLDRLGERTVSIDCDVLQADGGTRTAAITGSWVALAIALGRVAARGVFKHPVLRDSVAAVSVGVVGGQTMIDLAYVEDSTADVDMNVVQTGRGAFVELQGTAEADPFARHQLEQMLELAALGLGRLTQLQLATLEKAGIGPASVLEGRREG